MDIKGFSKLTPKERQRLSKKMSKKQKRDMLQPYLPNGKRNGEFEKVYGKYDPKIQMGESQDQYMQEIWDKQHWEDRQRKGLNRKKVIGKK